MVGIVNAIASAQNAALKSAVQSMASPEPAPPPPLSSINFVASGIHVDNLQNVAILEYRSAKTGDVIRQYPDQSQIDAFKAAERLAQVAAEAHQQQAQSSAPSLAAPSRSSGDTPVFHQSTGSSGAGAFAAHASVPASVSSGSTGGSPSGNSTVSIMA